MSFDALVGKVAPKSVQRRGCGWLKVIAAVFIAVNYFIIE